MVSRSSTPPPPRWPRWRQPRLPSAWSRWSSPWCGRRGRRHLCQPVPNGPPTTSEWASSGAAGDRRSRSARGRRADRLGQREGRPRSASRWLEVAPTDDAGAQRGQSEACAFLVLRQVVHAEALEQRSSVPLTVSTLTNELVGDLLIGGRGGVGRSLNGRQRANATRRCAGVSSPPDRGRARRPDAGGGPPPAANAIAVSPTTTTSPSRSRRRAVTRSPLTNVPLRDSLSSYSTHPLPRARSPRARATPRCPTAARRRRCRADRSSTAPVELDHELSVVCVAKDQERGAAAFGGDALLQLVRRGDVRIERRLRIQAHRNPSEGRLGDSHLGRGALGGGAPPPWWPVGQSLPRKRAACPAATTMRVRHSRTADSAIAPLCSAKWVRWRRR